MESHFRHVSPNCQSFFCSSASNQPPLFVQTWMLMFVWYFMHILQHLFVSVSQSPTQHGCTNSSLLIPQRNHVPCNSNIVLEALCIYIFGLLSRLYSSSHFHASHLDCTPLINYPARAQCTQHDTQLDNAPSYRRGIHGPVSGGG